MEFVIANQVKVHPMALVHFDALTDDKAAEAIAHSLVATSARLIISSIGSHWDSRALPRRTIRSP